MDVFIMLQIRSAPARGGALNNHTISSSIASTVPSDWEMSARRTRVLQEWRMLTQTLRLPDTWQSFLLFTLGIAVASVALLLHLQLSTTILQDKFRLESLQAEERVIAEQNANLVWAIVQETELNSVKARATALGYEPALQRNYMIIPGDTVAAEQQSNIAQTSK